jgi:hypothetical protein
MAESKIRGYRDLTETEIELINECKDLVVQVLAGLICKRDSWPSFGASRGRTLSRMRKNPTPWVEAGRLLVGEMASPPLSGCNGMFIVSNKLGPHTLAIIASDGTDKDARGWEHVSVSTAMRTPTWKEMQWVKEQFWNDDEVVIQLHPAKVDYVNCHPNTLHMWRHHALPFLKPPVELV